MQNLKIRVNNEAEAEEVKRLAVKAGYKLDALFGKKWSAEFCYLVLCENMSAGFGNEIMADGDKPLSIGELRAMANPMKEYLDANRNYQFVLSTEKEDGFIEIPEGAEIAIQFKNNPYEHGIVFYKNGGKSCMCKGDNNWQHDSEWIMDQLLNENYHDGEIDLSHEILWQRDQDEPFLTPECTLNDQYAEIEEVRQHSHYFKDVSNLNEIDVYMVLKLFNVTDPCLQHIAKKALCAGQRGHKDFKKDLQDILDTAKRAVEINNG